VDVSSWSKQENQQMNWKTWLIGLGNGAVSAIASGFATGMVGGTWKQTAAVAGTSAVVSVAKWVAQHPLPGAPSN
jgi:hypothetical protein